MPNSYVAVLRRPGAAAFVAAGFVGRLPISMVPLGIVLLVTASGGNYALAGALSAAYALCRGGIGPFGRPLDRPRAARPGWSPSCSARRSSVCCCSRARRSPDALAGVRLVLPLILAGAAAPNVGSLVRARWAAILSGARGAAVRVRARGGRGRARLRRGTAAGDHGRAVGRRVGRAGGLHRPVRRPEASGWRRSARPSRPSAAREPGDGAPSVPQRRLTWSCRCRWC